MIKKHGNCLRLHFGASFSIIPQFKFWHKWVKGGKFVVITTGVNAPKVDKVERLSMISVGETMESK